MIIHEKTIFQWDDKCKRYIKVYDQSFEYLGSIALACGASSGQKQIGAAQSATYNQMVQQAGDAMGTTSGILSQLVATFTPTVNAGPNQQGFSPQLLSAMNSQAITNAGVGYRNAKAAVGNAQAAVGGGNVDLPSGAQIGENTQLAENFANQTANSLNQITQENYSVGRQNYENAVRGLEAAPGVLNAGISAENAATGAGSAAANTQNQISQQNNSWMSAVSGALGGVLGGVTGGLTNMLFKPQGGSQGATAGEYADTMGSLAPQLGNITAQPPGGYISMT